MNDTSLNTANSTANPGQSAATPTASPVLSINNLTIDLPANSDRDYAVSNVSIDVAPGEVVCLVGESGSGKSVIAFSVMGLLAKALTVSGGSISLQDENLLTASKERLRDLRCTGMGMIFCLLYTSPSPRDRTRSRMPSSA